MFTGQILFVWEAKLRKDYEVRVESWHNAAFELCSYPDRVFRSELKGVVAFRNPYGYIPAELYGLRPFEVRHHIFNGCNGDINDIILLCWWCFPRDV
jgi:hypothetical protein